MTKHGITTVMSVLYDENDASTYPLKKVSIVSKSLECGESIIKTTRKGIGVYTKLEALVAELMKLFFYRYFDKQ